MLDLKKYPYINVAITFYMRVNNSPMFGGKGSAGYTNLAMDECKNINDVPIEEMLSDLKCAESKLFECCEDDIELIDKKTYDENTEDEIEAVEKLPAADAVKVVHCKDCRYRDFLDSDYGGYCCEIVKREVQLDDYCSFGERRNGND